MSSPRSVLASRRRFLLCRTGSCLLQPANAARPPNIVLLLTDDQRWDTLGAMGNRLIRTPNLDRLAAEGVTFVNSFVTTSICMASRASMFTGQYVSTHGLNDFNEQLSPARFSDRTWGCCALPDTGWVSLGSGD